MIRRRPGATSSSTRAQQEARHDSLPGGDVEVRLVTLGIQWINGSFATRERDPGDVDIATFMQSAEVEMLSPERQDELNGLMASKDTTGLPLCDSFARLCRGVAMTSDHLPDELLAVEQALAAFEKAPTGEYFGARLMQSGLERRRGQILARRLAGGPNAGRS